jgi:hypothetical protein
MNSFRSLVLSLRLRDRYELWPAATAALWCAGHAQQFGGESPPVNLMEVIVSRRRESVMLYER